MNPEKTKYLRDLRRLLVELFDPEELEMLAFDLSVDWDELAGGTKSRKVQSFIMYLARRGQLESLLTLLREPDQTTTERALFWHYPHFSTMGGRPSGAIRKGPWKLIEHFETGGRELYNLRDDIGETVDLSSAHPDTREELHQSLVDWRARMKAILPSRPNPNCKSG